MTSVVLFALVAMVLVGVALAFVLPTLMRERARRQDASRAAISADIYRQEVDELRVEVARGELGAEQARLERAELRRRRVDEASAVPGVQVEPRRRRAVVLLVAVALPVVATSLYLAVGKPEALTAEAVPDDPGEGDYVSRLQSHLSRQPRDGRGWVLLARAQADRGAFREAAASFEKALTVSTKVAKDPGVLCEYADALGMVQGGRLSGRPSELVMRALAMDPKHPMALDMAGSAAYADGRYAEAVRYWSDLLDELPAASPRRADLTAAIARAERKAAVSLPR
jgi:cytochrome c-type biogenesis protein CcmH